MKSITDKQRHSMVLLKVKVRRPQGTRKRNDVTHQVLSQHNASSDAGVFTQQLFSAAQMKPVNTAASNVSAVVAKHGALFGITGMYAIPASTITDVMVELRAATDAFNAAVESLTNEYYVIKLDAQQRLGSLWDELMFPSKEEFTRMFEVQYEILPVPDSADMMLVHCATTDALVEQAQAQEVERYRAVITSAVDRFRDAIGQFATAANRESTRFYESNITNLERELRTLRGFADAVGSDELSAMVADAELLLLDIGSIDKIRASDAHRSAMGDKASELADTFDTLGAIL